MAFVDYEKAFHYIQHRAAFETLRKHGVQEKYINIFKETHTEGTAQARTEKLSGKIKIMKGIRQGDTISPVLLTAVVEEIFMRMNIEAGININGVRLSNLRFADDIVLGRRRPRRGVMMDAEQLEELAECKYLGRLITSGNERNKEIDQRITSGCRRFGEYSHFLKESKIPICLKRKIMDTVILPVMT